MEKDMEFINIKKEHAIMKRIIVENGLWERLLNDDEFIKYLRDSDDEIDDAVKIVKNFNETNRFRDGGQLNNAVDKILNALEYYRQQHAKLIGGNYESRK